VLGAVRKLRLAGALSACKRGFPRRGCYRLLVVVPVALDPYAAPAPRALHPYERMPEAEVGHHPAFVGPREMWRGKSWRGMPGRSEVLQKANFFLWRRGMLNYRHLPAGKRRMMREMYGV
jgi:hypothetical protein